MHAGLHICTRMHGCMGHEMARGGIPETFEVDCGVVQVMATTAM